MHRFFALIVGLALFGGVLHAGVVNQDLPHHLGGDPQKMPAIAIARLLLPQHPGVELVYQRRRLERMARTLLTDIAVRNPAKLVVNQRDQAVKSALVAPRKVLKQMGDSPGFGEIEIGGHCQLFYRLNPFGS